MTETQLLKVFSKHGLKQISPSEGDAFDPNFHDAVFQVPPPSGNASLKAGAVAVVSKIGYSLHDRVIRPASVGVFRKS